MLKLCFLPDSTYFVVGVLLLALHFQAAAAVGPDFSEAINILNNDNNYTGYAFLIGDASGTLLVHERGLLTLFSPRQDP